MTPVERKPSRSLSHTPNRSKKQRFFGRIGSHLIFDPDIPERIEHRLPYPSSNAINPMPVVIGA